MKSLIIISVLLIFFAYSVQARYDVRDTREVRCARAKFIQKQHAADCIGEQMNETEFELDANGTLWNFRDRMPMVYLVRHFANKYCPKLNRAIHCMRLEYNLPVECLTLFQKEENYLRTEILAEILKLFCTDNAQKLLQVLQHDGLLTIYNNDVFFECFFMIDKYPFVALQDKVLRSYQINPEFCDGLQEAHECYIDYVDLHLNQDLWKIADDVHTIARNILNCETVF